MPAFLNEYTMYIKSDDFGRIVTWDEDEDAFELMMASLAFAPGEGLMALELADRTLQFLVKSCQEILHDKPPKTLTGENTPIFPEPPPLMAGSEESPTMVSINVEAPYRMPADLDFRRLQAVFSASRSAAEDHI